MRKNLRNRKKIGRLRVWLRNSEIESVRFVKKIPACCRRVFSKRRAGKNGVLRSVGAKEIKNAADRRRGEGAENRRAAFSAVFRAAAKFSRRSGFPFSGRYEKVCPKIIVDRLSRYLLLFILPTRSVP
ncbi:MAG: hypothetical protein JSS81_12620 [Acidobacteria bacterium]|nr:hypothetical protein [Acidobacteriota bacterium]